MMNGWRVGLSFVGGWVNRYKFGRVCWTDG